MTTPAQRSLADLLAAMDVSPIAGGLAYRQLIWALMREMPPHVVREQIATLPTRHYCNLLLGIGVPGLYTDAIYTRRGEL